MRLNPYVAALRLALLEDLRAGVPLREGRYDESVLKEGRSKGQPQLGATRYEPDAIVVEFIFPDPKGAAVLLPVTLTPPERIVFLPVPEWVVESIWQGEIDGTYQFESDALSMVESFRSLLTPEANAPLFQARRTIGKA